MSKLKLKVKPESFSDFVSKLGELTQIEDSIKIKINNDDILMYSMVGESILLAFKNYSLKTKDYFDIAEFDFMLDIIIINAKKFVKNLGFLKSDKISIDVTYKSSSDDDDVMCARALQITGGKFKVNLLAGDQHEMRDMNKKVLDQRLDLKNKKWGFSISKSDFADVRKLSNINSEKIITITAVDSKVVLSETAAWELEVDQVDSEINSMIMFSKQFLPCIDETQDVEFNMFETFILIKDSDSNLILSFEQTFD